jgi:predicted MFS family arabinose efflux permease
MFAQFLFLPLYLENVLGYSAVKTGVIFLPLSLVSFVVAPIAGRLSTRIPVRILLGGGLAVIGVALLLMHGIALGSTWTTLLAGFIVGGIGIGLVNAPLASTSVSVVEPRRAGMASGINNTFRQVGIATGIAALGAIFQSQIASSLESDGVPHRVAGKLGQAIASGAGPQFSAGRNIDLDHSAFISGLNTILLVSAFVLFAGAILAFVLVRQQDFVESGAEAAAASG